MPRSRAIIPFAPDHAAGGRATLWDGIGLGAETAVATPSGPVPAGRLRRGDQVLGPGGMVATLAGLRHLILPEAAFRRLGLAPPVRLAAGVLGFGLPTEPLWLGPAQRLRLEGGWVAAGLLGEAAGGGPGLVRLEVDGPGVLAAGVVLAGGPGPTDADAAVSVAARLGGGAALTGFVDHADRHGVRGWALDPAAPRRVVALEAVAEGVVLARGLADLPRPDLVAAGLAPAGGGARHGFALRFAAPLPAGRPWLLHLRPAGGGAGLPGSPLLLDAAIADPARFDRALAVLGDGAADVLAALVESAPAARHR